MMRVMSCHVCWCTTRPSSASLHRFDGCTFVIFFGWCTCSELRILAQEKDKATSLRNVKAVHIGQVALLWHKQQQPSARDIMRGTVKSEALMHGMLLLEMAE
jgi:hypothetical protein